MDLSFLAELLREGSDKFGLWAFVSVRYECEYNKYHFVTRIIYDTYAWDVHTETAFEPDIDYCATRILNDISHLIAGQCAYPNEYWKEQVAEETPVGRSFGECPVCGASGDDLVFRFYCSNRKCANYHP